jgi:hypothetical protein
MYECSLPLFSHLLNLNLGTRFLLGGGGIVTPLVFTIDSPYTLQYIILNINGNKEQSNSFFYFSNQVNKCMCGNFKFNHAIMSI